MSLNCYNYLNKFTLSVLLIALGLAGINSAASAQTIENFEYRQVVIQPEDGPPELTNIGECRISMTPGPDNGFVQVMGQDQISGDWVWIGQNFWIPMQDWTPDQQHNSFRFPLDFIGIADGEFFEFINYGWVIDTEPRFEAPDPTELQFSNSPAIPYVETTFGRNPSQPFTPDNVTWYPDWTPPVDIFQDYYIDCTTMPNIDLDSSNGSGDYNGCGPAAAANSLTWLKATINAIDFPQDLRAAFDMLSDLMNRHANGTVTDRDFIRAKLDLIEMYNLPIQVSYSGSTLSGPISSSSGNTTASTPDTDDAANPSSGWVTDQIASGADVEIGVTYPDGKGHWVTGNGCIILGGFTWIDFKHDKSQGTQGGNEQDGSWVDEAADGTMVLPGMGNAKVDIVVVEKYVPGYVPVPPQDTLKKYCDWIYRTIPPNSTGTVSFPEQSGRCMNTTIWVQDHSQNPPTWKKETVWNFNSGEDRDYENDGDSPVTIAIHMDDKSEGEIPVEIEIASEGNPSTPSNEEEFAGFSLGGSDGSSGEYGVITDPQVAVTVDANFDLSKIPSNFSPTGTNQLTLDYEVLQYNEYWTDLVLVLNFVDVTAAGILNVQTTTGINENLQASVGASGFEINLGRQPKGTDFQIVFQSDGTLEFELDYVGVASEVPVYDDSHFGMTFDQVDFEYEGNATANSTTGILHTEFTPLPGDMFLNVVATTPGHDNVWIVRNMFLPSEDYTTFLQSPTAKFDLEQLGINEGDDFTQVEAGWIITTEPQDETPFIPGYRWDQYQVGDFSQDAIGRPVDDVNDPPIEYPTYYPIYTFPFTIEDVVYISCSEDDPTSMPNIPLDSSARPTDWNGCGPASAANSLKWLDRVHDEIDLPPDLREAYDQLRNLMQYTQAGGVGDFNFVRGKLDIIEAYDLPIKVKYQGVTLNGNISSTTGNSSATSHDTSATDYPHTDWLIGELKDDEDVELGITYPGGQGHWITASGTITINGQPYVFFKHDAEQKDSTGNITGWSPIRVDSLGRMTLPNEGNAVIDIVVSESYDPDHSSAPTSKKFDEYCQWLKKTIPANSKIEFTYPVDNDRCMNATVWVYDRTGAAPEWKRDRVWNINSGETRTFVNENDYPITIAVHNDDNADGEYTIDFVVSPNIDEQSSVDNEADYGGFSLGGTDGSAGEFGTSVGATAELDIANGASLSDIAGGFTQGDMRTLTLTHPVTTWNQYWTGLELKMTVLSADNEGILTVTQNGTEVDRISINSTGEVVLPLNSVNDGDGFELVLEADGTLEFIFDNIGVASTVPMDLPDEITGTFEQVDFNYPDYQIQNSTVGMVNITYTPAEETQFLNIVAKHPQSNEDVWIVRNMFLPSSYWTEYEQSPSFRFDLSDLGYTEGTDVTQIQWAWDLSTDYSVETPTIESFRFSNSDVTDMLEDALGRENIVIPSDIETVKWDPKYIYEMLFKDTVYISCNPSDPKSMPNGDLDSSKAPNDWYGCGPASAANSLLWLEKNHPEIDIKPEWKKAFKELAALMKKPHKKGVQDGNFVRAKLDFIEMYDLPIKVKFQSKAINGDMKSTSGNSSAKSHDKNNSSYPTRDWMVKEAKDEEDVEVGFVYPTGGGHWVTLSGLGSLDSNTTIYFKHDTEQEKAGGTKTEGSPIKFDSLGRMTLPKKSNGIIDIVVSESFDPNHKSVPKTMEYKKFCQKYKRTIRPKSKLIFTYPENDKRCFNSTIYVIDHSKNPRTEKKVAVWNLNSGKTRTYVNNTDYPVTVIVHNDDNYLASSGGVPFPADNYTPWTIDSDYLDYEDGDASDASNMEDYGGFSLGGQDSTETEFGEINEPSVEFEASEGCDLSEFPQRLGASGVSSLKVTHRIDDWNRFWDSLEVVIGVYELETEGQIRIQSDACGFDEIVDIDDRGEFSWFIGGVPESPAANFDITLSAIGAVDFSFDYFAVPTVANLVVTSVEYIADDGIRLYQNNPNPFDLTTEVGFELPHRANAKLEVYNTNGDLVAVLANDTYSAGKHDIRWNGIDMGGRQLPSGVYIAKLVVGETVLTIKMALSR